MYFHFNLLLRRLQEHLLPNEEGFRLTHEDLAAEVGISRAHLGAILGNRTDRTNVSFRYLLGMANAVDIYFPSLLTQDAHELPALEDGQCTFDLPALQQVLAERYLEVKKNEQRILYLTGSKASRGNVREIISSRNENPGLRTVLGCLQFAGEPVEKFFPRKEPSLQQAIKQNQPLFDLISEAANIIAPPAPLELRQPQTLKELRQYMLDRLRTFFPGEQTMYSISLTSGVHHLFDGKEYSSLMCLIKVAEQELPDYHFDKQFTASNLSEALLLFNQAVDAHFFGDE